MIIKSFSGENRYLSNFWLCPVIYDGITWPSSEAAYQAQKMCSFHIKMLFVDIAPGNSKKLAMVYKNDICPYWNNIKFEIMTSVVRCKFDQNPDLKQKLIQTGDVELIEGNTWRDIYWGVYRGIGQNNLGKILMTLRKHYQAEGN